MPHTIDVTGLSAKSVQAVESLVKLLREKDAKMPLMPLTPGKLDKLFDSLSKGLHDLPELPSDYSRNNIYDDHD